ncbi:esterase-like activity of phytase family protein [Novosphingobium olei]|uniref:esterase-like activity of phytase family protein n=1 Tax=Novosphingobium olei TaxID=2728851 RepID=UPI00308A9F73|nr:esterase-like activity of phytase family protein [Novosphingobium olei]
MRLIKLFLLLPLLVLLLVAGVIRDRDPLRQPRLEPQGALGLTDLLGASGPIAVGPDVQIVGAWAMRGGFPLFGNYSALTFLPDGRLFALGDRNSYLVMQTPDRGTGPVAVGMPFPVTWPDLHISTDAESVSAIAGTGQLLVGREGTDRLAVFDPDMTRFHEIRVRELREWGFNQGPEAMRQLADGRLVLIAEMRQHWYDRSRYPGFVFRGIPQPGERPARFVLDMPEGFRPTELAQLPDGRVLVLGRKFTVTGFYSVIVTADPGDIRAGAEVRTQEIARIGDSRVRENYEGMAVRPERDGSATIWLVSDSNTMVWLQRTILLKLHVRKAGEAAGRSDPRVG